MYQKHFQTYRHQGFPGIVVVSVDERDTMSGQPHETGRNRWRPSSIYRVPVDRNVTLFDVTKVIPHIAELGFTAIRLSPITAASTANETGAPTDPNTVDPHLGGLEGLHTLSSAAHNAHMGVIVDFVPGALHVAHPSLNPYWWDVLLHGQDSQYANWFDIQWTQGKVTVVVDQPATTATLTTNPATNEPVLKIGSAIYPINPETLRSQNPQNPHDPHAILAAQNYTCVERANLTHPLNYRRVNADSNVAAIRVNDPHVFAETHRELARWFDTGLIDGVSVRHIDSIADPQAYLDQLQDLTGGYIITEKRFTLNPEGQREVTPESWPGSASTTYPLITAIDGALTHPIGFYELESFRQHLAAGLDPHDRSEISPIAKQLRFNPTSVTGLLTLEEVQGKKEVTNTRMRSEMVSLAITTKNAWDGLDESTRARIRTDPTAQVDVDTLAGILGIVAASVSVARPELGLDKDAEVVREGFLSALSESEPDDFLGRNSTGEVPVMTAGSMVVPRALAKVRSTVASATASDRLLAYVGLLLTTPDCPVSVRFSQTTSDVFNLGVTARAHYRYCTLAALNEVGGLPSEPGHPDRIMDEFHIQTSTTSAPVINGLTSPVTKYSRTERCRILALSEIPQKFMEFVADMRDLAPLDYASTQATASGTPAPAQEPAPTAPDTSFDILLWQSIVGAWDPQVNVEELVNQAARAARLRYPSDDRFVESVRNAVHAALAKPEVAATVDHMAAIVRHAGYRNSQVARAVQLFSPGIPEVFDPLFVNPHERLVSNNPSDRLLQDGLAVRARHPHIFASSSLAPPSRVAVTGERAEHAFGLAHFGDGQFPDVVVVVERLPITLRATGGWGDTRFHIPTSVTDDQDPAESAPTLQTMALPVIREDIDPTWRDALSGHTWTGVDFSVAEVLSTNPVAVLERVRS